METLSYCRTPSHVFMSDPSQPGAEQEGRRTPQIKRTAAARLERQERVTNQTRCIAGQEGQSALQIKAAPSAGWPVKQITATPSHLPLVRVEEKKNKTRHAVAADIKNTERERE